MKIYGDYRSGNCYKLKLVTSILQIAHDWVSVDILAGEAASAEFAVLNTNRKIPLLQLADGRTLAESNAILNFLARGSILEPEDDFGRAKVQQWQFFEQYSHEPYIAVARFIALYLALPENRRDEYESKQQGGHKALAVMDQQLQQTPFLVGDELTTADISLYAYTHVAHEGGFELTPYPAIQGWLSRVQATPGYVAMETQ